MLEMLKVIHLGVIAPLLKINSYVPKNFKMAVIKPLIKLKKKT